MPNWRKDSIVDRWVIVAEDRAERPGAFETPSQTASNPAGCPFCEGSESQTPGEVFALRIPSTEPNGPGWQLRVVPNKYPALALGDAGKLSVAPFQVSRPAAGRHEVIIESPRHVSSFSELTPHEARDAVWAYRERLHQLRLSGSYRHALIFKNVGPAAGASIEHTHSQLMATDFVPQLVAEELQAAHHYYVEHRACIYCKLVETELELSERVVDANDDFVVLSPYAARFPYETWLLPKRHQSHFEDADRATTDALAETLARTVSVVEKVCPAWLTTS